MRSESARGVLHLATHPECLPHCGHSLMPGRCEWPYREARPHSRLPASSRLQSLLHGCAYSLIQIFDRFDEMRLTHKDVGIGRKFDADRFDFKHSSPSTWM